MLRDMDRRKLLFYVWVALLMLFPGLLAQGRTAVLRDVELREYLRTAWRTGDTALLTYLIPSLELFFEPDEAIAYLDRIVVSPSHFPFTVRVLALRKTAELMPGASFGPYLQRLFLDRGEVPLQREIIRLLGSTDNWIPFLWSIAEGIGLEEKPESERIILRFEAFGMLARWQILEALPVFFRFLEQESMPTFFFSEAQKYLCAYDQRAFPYLSAFLQSSDERFRRLVIPALSRMGQDGRAIVFEALNDPCVDVREAALLHLIRTGPLDAGLIMGMIDPKDMRIQGLVRAFILSQEGQGELPCLPDGNDRTIMGILARTEPGVAWLVRSTKGVEELEIRLLDQLVALDEIFPHPDLWRILEKHEFSHGTLVTQFDPEFVQERLLPEVKNRPELFTVLVSAAQPFSRQTLLSHLYWLRALLREGEERVRGQVVRALFPLGTEALPVLEPLMDERSEYVVTEIVNLLRLISSPAVARYLERVLDHPSVQVQTMSRLAFLELLEREGLRMIWLSR